MLYFFIKEGIHIPSFAERDNMKNRRKNNGKKDFLMKQNFIFIRIKILKYKDSGRRKKEMLLENILFFLISFGNYCKLEVVTGNDHPIFEDGRDQAFPVAGGLK